MRAQLSLRLCFRLHNKHEKSIACKTESLPYFNMYDMIKKKCNLTLGKKKKIATCGKALNSFDQRL